MTTKLKGVDLYSHLRDTYTSFFPENSMFTFPNLMWQIIINTKDKTGTCLTPVYREGQLEIAIARRDEDGYLPTHVAFNNDVTHKQADEIIIDINKLVYGRTEEECYKIIQSSMKSIVED